MGISTEELKIFDLRVQRLDHRESQLAYIQAIKYLLGSTIPSGPQYLDRWEMGWGENFRALLETRDLSALIPRYLTKNKIFRIMGSYYSSPNPLFELDFARIIVFHFIKKYMSNINTIIDLGSGSCHYTWWLAEKMKLKSFLALDWSKQSNKIANTIGDMGLSVSGRNFDMYNPMPMEETNKPRALLTIGSLEQLGLDFEPILNWIQASKFQVVLNIEPIYEFYDRNELFDFLPSEYILRRNWLRGFLPRLRALQVEKKVEILEERRIFGSLHHETYNILAWRFNSKGSKI